MRILLLISMLVLIIGLNAQHLPDSLVKALKRTPVTRQTLTQAIQQIQALSPEDSLRMKALFNWVDNNSNYDSLAEVKASAHLAMGRKYTLATKYGEAVKYLTVARSISERKNFPVILAQTLNILGSVYQSNEPSGKAIGFYKESLEISIKHDYKPGIIKARYNLGKLMLETALSQHKNTAPAINEMKNAFEMALSLKDTQSIINQSNGLASIYSTKKKYDSSIYYLNIAGKFISQNNEKTSFLNLYSNLATNYTAKNNYKQAISYLNEGLSIAKEINAPRWMCTYYYGLADTYEKSGDYQKANYYNRLNIQMHNTLVTQENFIAAADLQNKYESVRKDNAILKLAGINRQKVMLNRILFGATIALLMISFLSYMYYRKNRQLSAQEHYLQKQKIREMEKDRQLLAIDAMFKGQEEERSRIARELHDGLGSLLSSTKHSFSTIKEGLVLSPGHSERYDKSLHLLDATISDLKKVAQNLIPEVLAKFGLNDAIVDFCRNIQNVTGIKIIFQQLGDKRKLDSTAEIFVYRIIQELINNAVKHANAKEIFVELLVQQKNINLTVEDDGEGFKNNALHASSGAGMKNVRDRVQYFNGSMEVESRENNGTSVYINMFV